MVSSNRQVFACILLFLAAVSYAHAQKDQTSSISGKVTLKNKGIAGIVVAAVDTNYRGGGSGPRHRGTTDAEGNYRIENVPAGSYHVTPIVRALVVDKAQLKQVLAVGAGETIRDINFALVRGGVITGKVTNADGEPLIEERVNVTPVDVEPDYDAFNYARFLTDDRGVYRVFGLRQGKYRVSVGGTRDSLPGETRQVFKQTFYPSVTDPEKATIIEVSEGGELRNVDIEVEPPLSSFKVTGKIIDGETGKPLPHITLGVERTDDNFGITAVGPIASNKDGEFKLENVIPGHYRLFADPGDQSDWRADSLKVEVVDKDLTGLEIKTRKGASLAGIVVLQTDERVSPLKLEELVIYAMVKTPSEYNGGYGKRLAPDGSFKLGGLASGRAEIMLSTSNRSGYREIEIASVELDGVAQPKGIDLKDGEQINGIRVFARYNSPTGAIHGLVKIEDGELPPGSEVQISVKLIGERPPSSSRIRLGGSSPQLDSRGRFIAAQLEPGLYEVSVTVLVNGQSFETPKQQVNVTNNAVTDVTLTLKLKP
jgi:protocatechuate 3,4-dioxygenase beta subunit